MTQIPPLDAPEDWDVFETVFRDAAGRLPALGLNGSAWSALNVRRKHGQTLKQLDAVRQTVSGRWLAHRARFAPALFELMTRGPDEILAAARARSANQAPEAA
jgi:hypothetical protein